jgi:hypothetical protein
VSRCCRVANVHSAARLCHSFQHVWLFSLHIILCQLFVEIRACNNLTLGPFQLFIIYDFLARVCVSEPCSNLSVIFVVVLHEARFPYTMSNLHRCAIHTSLCFTCSTTELLSTTTPKRNNETKDGAPFILFNSL